MLRRSIAGLIALVTLGSSGCATHRATATADPSLRWDQLKSLHVRQLEGEDESTKKLIVERLRAAGFSVSADPEPVAQPDAIVTYVDKWIWDFTMYMMELTITLRRPGSEMLLATGNSFHNMFGRKQPNEMVDEVVTNILRQRGRP